MATMHPLHTARLCPPSILAMITRITNYTYNACKVHVYSSNLRKEACFLPFIQEPGRLPRHSLGRNQAHPLEESRQFPNQHRHHRPA